MRRYPDWLLVFLATLMLATSTAIVAVSAALVPFILCELAQGCARGAFWTVSQTHVVRSSATAVSGMAKMNLASAVGLLMGPLIAGLLAEQSLTTALVLASGIAAVQLKRASSIASRIKAGASSPSKRLWT